MNGMFIYVYIFKDLPAGMFLSVEDPPAVPEAGQLPLLCHPKARRLGRLDQLPLAQPPGAGRILHEVGVFPCRKASACW